MLKLDSKNRLVPIEDIEKESVLQVEFEDEIKELDGCKVYAELDLKLLGEFSEVSGHA